MKASCTYRRPLFRTRRVAYSFQQTPSDGPLYRPIFFCSLQIVSFVLSHTIGQTKDYYRFQDSQNDSQVRSQGFAVPHSGQQAAQQYSGKCVIVLVSSPAGAERLTTRPSGTIKGTANEQGLSRFGIRSYIRHDAADDGGQHCLRGVI